MVDKFLTQLTETIEITDRTLQLTDELKSLEEWDSLAQLSVIAMIDEEYGIVLDGKVFKSVTTVQELWDAVQNAKTS